MLTFKANQFSHAVQSGSSSMLSPAASSLLTWPKSKS
jgi:hypothetical protein